MNPTLLLLIPLLPLIAAVLAGVFGRVIGRAGSHTVTIACVAISCALSIYVLKQLYWDGVPVFNAPVYSWLISDGMHMDVGFLIDRLSALMMVVVTFVSLCVHIYTIGYMADDPGYQRFFAYISLFTFSMLMLVMANNFMQLFFGWDAVGGVLYSTRSMDYQPAFAAAPEIATKTLMLFHGHAWSALTVICICLFVGAMGKSAQIPLHVWLPDSMEGPTPISALINAATMVTAGIFMVARMSPLFEYSPTALSFVLVIGATTALFMGFLGIVNNDVKRVIAYSTLSQLGYMTVALGVSGYSVAIFHLMTHAFFKALLFLAAGAVIIAMHHEQDMRKMGGLRHRMPVFSGFYSKDALIEAVHASQRYGAGYAYWCVLLGVFVTALYTFRMIFMTFHGPERMDHHTSEHFHDVGWDMKAPLVALAIPSAVIGDLTIEPILFGGYFGDAIKVLPEHDVVGKLRAEWRGPLVFGLQSLLSAPAWLAGLGVLTAWWCVLKRPQIGADLRERFSGLYRLLVNKYYFDWFNENVLVPLARGLGVLLWRGGDQTV